MMKILGLLLAVGAALSGTRAALSSAQVARKSFALYDNMSYKRKPDTAKDGFIASDTLYEDKIWPNKREAGTLPNREAFEALVRAEARNPGPLVIDIERISLSRGSTETLRNTLETLEKLADWAHEALPRKTIGYYGTNTFSSIPLANHALALELARHVDAFFTPIYNFNDNRTDWETRAETAQVEAQALDPKKPLYFYLWPQYHVGSAKALRYVVGDFWKFQLETSRRYADGVVFWGPDNYAWNDKTGWWAATEGFVATLDGSGSGARR
jgi:hypothetical protein